MLGTQPFTASGAPPFTSSEVPPFTSFDTVETYAVKLAAVWNVPPQMVVVTDNLSFTPQFLNADEFIRLRLNKQSLMLTDRQLTKLAQQKNVSKLVLWVALSDFIGFILANTPDTLESGNYATVYEPEIRRRLDALNAYPVAVRENFMLPITLYSVKNMYSVSESIFNTSKINMLPILMQINHVQNVYATAMRDSDMRISDLIIVSEKLQLLITDNASASDVPSIFDKMIPTPHVRHIACRTVDDVFDSKYKPGPFDRLPEQKRIELNANINTIVFTVSTDISSYRFTYYVDDGYVEGTVKYTDKEQIISILRSFLPVQFTVHTDEYAAQVRLYPSTAKVFDLPVHYLLHRIVIQPELFPFYMNEQLSTEADKVTYELRFREYFNKDVGYIPVKGRKDEGIFTLKVLRLLDGSNYMSIDVLKVYSLSSLYRMMTLIIPAIVTFYRMDIDNGSTLAGIYNYPIPPPPQPKNLSRANISTQLNDEWPTIFTKAYLSSVKNLRNLVITTTNPLDAQAWSTQKIYKGEAQYQRMVGVFPPPVVGISSPQPIFFWYTSINPDAPFIGLSLNRADINPLYPLVPSSSVSPTGPRELSGTSKGDALSLMALTDIQKTGVAPEALDIIVGAPVHRQGVQKGPDSFLSAVNMVSGVAPITRASLLALGPHAFAQQFYDIPPRQLMQKLQDPTEWLDPHLYSPAVEMLVNADIFTIIPITRENETTHIVELPRHKEFFCRSGKVRRCIIIYKNRGVKSDALPHPHCELLLLSSASMPTTLPEEVSARLRFLSNQIDAFNHLTNRSMVHRSLCMSSSLHLIIDRFEVMHQMIDKAGKMRAITLIVDKTPVTFFCSPNAPLAVKRSDKVFKAPSVEWLEEFCGSSARGKSPAGVWIKHKASKEILYVRIDMPETISRSVPFVDFDPLSTGDAPDFIPMSVERDRMAIILRESLKWLLEVYISGAPNNASAFINDNLTYSSPDVPEQIHYIPSVTDIRVFPGVKSFAEACQFVQDNAIPRVGGKFVLHSLKYFECMVQVLKRYSNTVARNIDITARRYIPGIYTSLDDFKKYPNRLITIGKKSDFSSGIPRDLTVVTELRSSMLGTADPILYKELDPITGQVLFSLVQATQLADIPAAYAICDTWEKLSTNSGYKTLGAESMPVPVIVYSLKMSVLVPTLFLVEGKIVERRDVDLFYEIIMCDYKYYALLRL